MGGHARDVGEGPSVEHIAEGKKTGVYSCPFQINGSHMKARQWHHPPWTKRGNRWVISEMKDLEGGCYPPGELSKTLVRRLAVRTRDVPKVWKISMSVLSMERRLLDSQQLGPRTGVGRGGSHWRVFVRPLLLSRKVRGTPPLTSAS